MHLTEKSNQLIFYGAKVIQKKIKIQVMVQNYLLSYSTNNNNFNTKLLWKVANPRLVWFNIWSVSLFIWEEVLVVFVCPVGLQVTLLFGFILTPLAGILPLHSTLTQLMLLHILQILVSSPATRTYERWIHLRWNKFWGNILQ